MSTVRQIVQALANRLMTQSQAERAIANHTDWDPAVEPTGAQRHGVHDLPLPGDNSPDQIDMVPGLSTGQREALWGAAQRANRR